MSDAAPKPLADRFTGKVLLLVLDKALLGLAVFFLIAHMQDRMDALQERRDRATQVGDLMVDTSVKTLELLSKDVEDYTAEIRNRVRAGIGENRALGEARAKIDAKVATLEAFLPGPDVQRAGTGLRDVVQQLTVDAMTQRVPREAAQLDARVLEVNRRMAELAREVVAACRDEIKRNLDEAYR